MSIVEMLPDIRALPRIEKLRLIQLLAEELACAEEPSAVAAGQLYPEWSPIGAYDAAAELLKALESAKAKP